MSKTKITLAVTGLNNTDNPGPGIPVIRGIRESLDFDTRVIGLAYETLEPGMYMLDMVDKVYMVPYPSEGSDALIQRLEYINSIEHIDVLIPNFDAELYTFMKSGTRQEREQEIQVLCNEYAKETEKIVKNYPLQWFNYYDFWKIDE